MSQHAILAEAAPDRASETANGPELILVGTGKYRGGELLGLVVDLLQNGDVAPESLMVVTQTDGAARELAARARNRLNAQGIRLNANAMYAGSILSLCLRLLDEYREYTRMKRNSTVMDLFDQHYFIFQRLDDYRALANSRLVLGRASEPWKQAQTLLKRLNAVTEQAPDLGQLAAATHPGGRALAACYRLYLEHLQKANALDCSMAQFETLRLLEQNPEVTCELKSRLTYLIVDAAQQSSIIRDRIMRCLVDFAAGSGRPRYRLHGAATQDAAGFAASRSAASGFATFALAMQGETMPWWLA